MIKNYATFISAFPDDSEESPDGDVLVPDGRALASAIAGEISAARSPYQHSFYGWRFEFKCPSGRDAWVLLQQPGPWLLIVEAKTGWLERGTKKDAAFEEAVQLVKAAMTSISAISGISWLTQEEFTQSQRKK